MTVLAMLRIPVRAVLVLRVFSLRVWQEEGNCYEPMIHHTEFLDWRRRRISCCSICTVVEFVTVFPRPLLLAWTSIAALVPPTHTHLMNFW